MVDPLSELRSACAEVARRARHVEIEYESIDAYAASVPPEADPGSPEPVLGGTREELAAFWLTLDAINFGSGWFPTLRKRPGRSGYFTIADGIHDRFGAQGPWTAEELTAIGARDIAAVLGQDPDHELMGLFARSLQDLGAHVAADHDGRFADVVDSAGACAATLVSTLARWRCFQDTSEYEGIAVPFLKRAQIASADLALTGVARFGDLRRLTIFADNLVPHVLRLDGVLRFEPSLVARIESGELLEHGSAEEVEIRACAVQAVELVVRSRAGGVAAAGLDRLLWHRGQRPRYKSRPRHRSRCTAY